MTLLPGIRHVLPNPTPTPCFYGEGVSLCGEGIYFHGTCVYFHGDAQFLWRSYVSVRRRGDPCGPVGHCTNLTH